MSHVFDSNIRSTDVKFYAQNDTEIQGKLKWTMLSKKNFEYISINAVLISCTDISMISWYKKSFCFASGLQQAPVSCCLKITANSTVRITGPSQRASNADRRAAGVFETL